MTTTKKICCHLYSRHKETISRRFRVPGASNQFLRKQQDTHITNGLDRNYEALKNGKKWFPSVSFRTLQRAYFQGHRNVQ